jgi:hypothetical protein
MSSYGDGTTVKKFYHKKTTSPIRNTDKRIIGHRGNMWNRIEQIQRRFAEQSVNGRVPNENFCTVSTFTISELEWALRLAKHFHDQVLQPAPKGYAVPASEVLVAQEPKLETIDTVHTKRLEPRAEREAEVITPKRKSLRQQYQELKGRVA